MLGCQWCMVVRLLQEHWTVHLLCRMKPNGEAVFRTSMYMFLCDNSAVQNSSKCLSSVVYVSGLTDLNPSLLDSVYDLITYLIAAASLCYLMRPPRTCAI